MSQTDARGGIRNSSTSQLPFPVKISKIHLILSVTVFRLLLPPLPLDEMDCQLPFPVMISLDPLASLCSFHVGWI